MTSYVRGREKPNPVLRLAIRAGRWRYLARCVLQGKFSRKPYNKSFIDQACSVKMAGNWPRIFVVVVVVIIIIIILFFMFFFFFRVFMDLDSVSVHNHVK